MPTSAVLAAPLSIADTLAITAAAEQILFSGEITEDVTYFGARNDNPYYFTVALDIARSIAEATGSVPDGMAAILTALWQALEAEETGKGIPELIRLIEAGCALDGETVRREAAAFIAIHPKLEAGTYSLFRSDRPQPVTKAQVARLLKTRKNRPLKDLGLLATLYVTD